MKPRSLTIALLLLPLAACAAPATGANAADAAYVRVTNERAEKIVAKLELPQPKAVTVRDEVAQFYRDLNAIQTKRDAAVKAAKADTAEDKAGRDAAIKAARADAEQAREAVRLNFIGKLSSDLTPQQVEAVEDGLTYGVAPKTLRVYEEMLPNLTAEQKAQIHAWLVEAREHAIAGFTSEEKHGWFGKYKGRINNYLAKAGIDMKQAEHEFMARKPTGK